MLPTAQLKVTLALVKGYPVFGYPIDKSPSVNADMRLTND